MFKIPFKRINYWLLAIVLFTLALRLTLAFLTPNFTYDSYYNLRQVEHIAETGIPLYQDPLSYGGRALPFLPFFHYFMALFDLFLPLELLAKIIPALLFASLTIIVYLISKKITQQNTPSLLAAFIAGMLPILYKTNSFTVDCLFLPLVFLAIYFFLNLEKRKYLYAFLATILVLSFTSPATLLIIVGLLIYFLVQIIENKEIVPLELEIALISLFFFLWVQLVFFKETFLLQGVDFIWQNIPSGIIADYFPSISLIQSVLLVSIVPFLAGIFTVYRSLFQIKSHKTLLLIGLVLSATILAWLKLIKFNLSLSFFGLVLAIFFAIFYHNLIDYMQNTKFFSWRKYILGITIFLLTITMILPAISVSLKQETPSNEEIKAFFWLRDNSPQNSGVLATLPEGNLITYYAQRKNILDDQFGLIKNIEKRYQDQNTLFTTRFQAQALELLYKYNIQYLVLTPTSKIRYQIEDFNYLGSNCFYQVYNEETIIYQLRCELKAS